MQSAMCPPTVNLKKAKKKKRKQACSSTVGKAISPVIVLTACQVYNEVRRDPQSS